jgi:hypothetical protein
MTTCDKCGRKIERFGKVYADEVFLRCYAMPGNRILKVEICKECDAILAEKVSAAAVEFLKGGAK